VQAAIRKTLEIGRRRNSPQADNSSPTDSWEPMRRKFAEDQAEKSS
jgi:hypothetical protein